jgi:citrate synthase
MAERLAKEKGREDEFNFYQLVETEAVQAVSEIKAHGNPISTNLDFYTGLLYDLIGIPPELYTPLFAMARIAGWTAHRNEELFFSGRRIIRPAYSNVIEEPPVYVPLAKR